MTKIVVVGEAWGEQEERAGRAFVGPSGRLIRQWLTQAGIDLSDCHFTNVFNLRPRPTNDVINLCGLKADGIPHMKSLTKGKYVRAEYAPEVQRLWREIESHSPNLIIALGATAVWALVRGQNGIKKTRGTLYTSHLGRAGETGPKVLPTYHPAAVMRQWTLRPIVIADLAKAKKEAEFPELIRPYRELWVEPSLDDLWEFYERYIRDCEIVSTDIETKALQITEIGFAPSPTHAIVVPFYSRKREDGNYWRTHGEEMRAWSFVRHVLTEHRCLGQNFNYDMNYLWRYYGLTTPKATDDTMLLHHALQPEMEKGLGFLGSIYTEEPSWKFMRTDHSTLKAED